MNIVNGYVCRNCTDVELAKKGVDPAHPHDGPNGVDPQTPGASSETKSKDGASRSDEVSPDRGPAVTYAGALQGADEAQGTTSAQPASAWASLQPGQRLSLSA